MPAKIVQEAFFQECVGIKIEDRPTFNIAEDKESKFEVLATNDIFTVWQLNFLIFGNRRASSSKIDMNDRSRTGSRRSSVNNIASDCKGLTVPKKRLTKCPSESRYVDFKTKCHILEIISNFH